MAVSALAVRFSSIADDCENPFLDLAVEETIVSRLVKLFRSWVAPRNLMIALLVVVYGAGNICVPSMLCLISNSNPLQMLLGLFCIGALATEIGLLAAGVAFTRGSIVENVTVNSLLMVFMYASFIAGLQIASSLPPVTERSFSIRYIMLTTAAIAIAICVVRYLRNNTCEK